jgi:uncharacterized protein (TIGR00297 family)
LYLCYFTANDDSNPLNRIVLTFHFIITTFILIGMLLSVRTRKLTLSAALTGGALAAFIYFGVGYIGVVLLAAFFLLGVLATSWKRAEKANLVLNDDSQEMRTAGQVVANAGISGIAGLIAIIFPEKMDLFLIMIAAAFSSATADTLSSELGNLYGRKYYNITTFKRDLKGLDGVISLEGTLFGLVGSVLIALIYSLRMGWGQHFLWIIIAGTLGNFSDSILGATLEQRRLLKNDEVNFINTFIAALVISLIYVVEI